MLSIRLPVMLETRLSNLSIKTGRTKTYYVKKALTEFIEDMEDYYLAVERMENLGQTHTMEEIKNELNLQD